MMISSNRSRHCGNVFPDLPTRLLWRTHDPLHSSSISSRNNFNWRWFRAYEFMKLTVETTFIKIIYKVKIFVRKFCWCIMQWSWKSSFLLSPRWFINNGTVPLCVPITARAPSVGCYSMTANVSISTSVALQFQKSTQRLPFVLPLSELRPTCSSEVVNSFFTPARTAKLSMGHHLIRRLLRKRTHIPSLLQAAVI